jgi:WhiB family redox-sensing transcriptional regulator
MIAVPRWMDDAACLGMDTNRFFPIGDTGPALAQARQAKRVCDRCPVAASCLDWAIETRLDYGIAGGMTKDERAAERRRRHRRVAA